MQSKSYGVRTTRSLALPVRLYRLFTDLTAHEQKKINFFGFDWGRMGSWRTATRLRLRSCLRFGTASRRDESAFVGGGGDECGLVGDRCDRPVLVESRVATRWGSGRILHGFSEGDRRERSCPLIYNPIEIAFRLTRSEKKSKKSNGVMQ
jgi:hypothetical protein